MGDRYARQRVLPEVGAAGQARLATARVLVVGCGGLGGPVAAYLAGAGVGQLTLVDGDDVEVSNLHRQVFFAGPREQKNRNKARWLADHCRGLNPDVTVHARPVRLGPTNVRPLVESATLVLECTDDPATKYCVNDACHLLGVPLVYAAVHRYDGYVALFPNAGPEDVHLRDLFPDPDPTLPDCATAGVLPTAVGLVALLQANAALNWLLEIGAPPVRQLLTYSALDNAQRRIALRKTYAGPPPRPWTTAADWEVPPAAWAERERFAGVFSLLTEAQEPELPPGVVRISQRDPLAQCRARMRPGAEYLIYCRSGKLSLVLAGQLARAGLRAVSLRGGRRD